MADNMLLYLLAMVALVHPSICCCDTCVPVGVAYEDIIPDSSFTATSQYNDDYAPKNARLHKVGAWETKTNNIADEYLQVDLGKVLSICALATQGNAQTPIWQEWTTEYKISTSIDNKTWTVYPSNSSPKLFPGNMDIHTVVKNVLDILVQAKLIRFIPTKVHAWKTLRVKVYASEVCHDVPVGVAYKDIIPDSSFTATSQYNDNYAAKGARLYSTGTWEPNLIHNNDDYLQIDLGKVFYICAVATQGDTVDESLQEWTTEYNISTSINNKLWTVYPSNSSPKLFPGNTDVHTVVKNVLDIPVQAKLIRFIPTKYHTYKALRVEVYGRDVQVPKVPPGNVQAKAETSTSILVTWQVPSGVRCPADGYKVMYSLTSGCVCQDVTVNSGHVTSHRITNLNKWTVYYIIVKVYNDKGDGPASVAVVARTLEDAPSAPPDDFKATVLSSTNVKMSWSLPPSDQQNGIVRGFRVWYKKTTDSSPLPEIQISGNSTLHYVVDALDMYTEYYFKVLAYTNKDGSYSNIIKRRTHEGPPTAPTGDFKATVLSSTSVKLSWSLPPSDQQNGIVRGFRVWYKKTTDSSPLPEIKISGNGTLQYVVDKLDMYTEYYFKVLAYTNHDSPYSSIIKRRTHEGPPSAPRNVQTYVIKPSGSSGPQIQLTWDKPTDSNGIIRGYNVSYSKVGVSHTIHINMDSATLKTVLRVCGGKTYSVVVYPYTVVGGGSVTKTVPVDNYAPPAPIVDDIIIIKTAVTNITLWEASDTNGPIRGYQVIVSDVKDNKRRKRPIDEDELTNYNKAQQNGLSYYIAAELTPDCVKFPKKLSYTLGDGREYRGYQNIQLQKGKNYEVYQRALTQDGETFLPGETVLVANGTVIEDLDSGGKDQLQDGNKREGSWKFISYILAAVIVILIVVIVLLLIYVQRLRKQLHGKDMLNERYSRETPTADETVIENTNVTRPREAIAMTDMNPVYQHIDQFQNSSKRLPSQQQPDVDPFSVHAYIVNSPQQSDYQSLDKSTKDEEVYEELQPETRTSNPRNEDTDRTTYLSLANVAVEQPFYENLHMYDNTKTEVQI